MISGGQGVRGDNYISSLYCCQQDLIIVFFFFFFLSLCFWTFQKTSFLPFLPVIYTLFLGASSNLYFYFLTAATYFALSCVFYLLSFASMPNSSIITSLLLCPVAHKGPNIFHIFYSPSSEYHFTFSGYFCFSQISLSQVLLLYWRTQVLFCWVPISFDPSQSTPE